MCFWTFMKSLQKYFIMLTCNSALYTTQRCRSILKSARLIDLNKKCVQNRLIRLPCIYYSFQSLSTANDQNSDMRAEQSCRRLPFSRLTIGSSNMLNVHYRPLHSSLCSNSIIDYCKTDDLGDCKFTADRSFTTGSSQSSGESSQADSFYNYDLHQDASVQGETEAAKWDVSPALPPTFNVAAYSNESEIIQKLIDLGVDFSRLEKHQTRLTKLLLLSFEKDVDPVVEFLMYNGVSKDKIGWYFTKNPSILNESMDTLQTRIRYLESKKFTQEGIERIISVNPYWLSFSVIRIDRRLGFFQSYFKLSGNNVRRLAVAGPKLITSKLGRVQDATFKVKEEMGFEEDEIVQLLLSRPRIWTEDPNVISRRFDYLHNTVKIPHSDFVTCPDLLLVREERMKQRIGFLQHLGKAQFNPEKPNYISYKKLYEGTDVDFVSKVANSSVLQFNEYLKSL